MLSIRESQVRTFEERAQRAFEDEMVAHLADFSPPLFKTLGETQMRVAVQFGMDRAAAHDFTFRGPVRLYLEMMLLFGSHFETDPQYPWAAEILKKRDVDQMERAESLYEKTVDYREKIVGPDDAYALKALRNISMLAQQPLLIPSEEFVAYMRQEIARVYPQKAAYVGQEGIDALIRKGVDGARRQRFSTTRAAALIVVLMLAFGYGCGADPLYPWINKTLKDESLVDPEARAKRLEKKALTWLEHVLAYFEKGA
ncbi:MAG TPA: hypothetical protein DIC59_14050 [Candidatus Competibacteraceae bacterium]|nr:hypothetical protein [Candidatus Competibacteraceae bacterium]